MSGMDRRSFVLAGAAALAATGVNAAPVVLGGAKLNLHLAEGGAAKETLIRQWVTKSATAVINYYGKFPVPEVDIVVSLRSGARVGGGRTSPGVVPTIAIGVGSEAGDEALLHRDWVMVHEMIHLAFPWMNLRHNWMAEGLAVYVEGVARVRAGHIPEEQIWADFAKAMPEGLPQEGDEGLDKTVTWGRTYWGGALFCLLADIAIIRETGMRFGLQTALRAINAARDFRTEYPLMETLAIGDAATGRNVLVTQYEAMRDTPVSTDLPVLWRNLGVNAGDNAFRLDANAPWADVRRAIVAA
jgi:hypothetical protein